MLPRSDWAQSSDLCWAAGHGETQVPLLLHSRPRDSVCLLLLRDCNSGVEIALQSGLLHSLRWWISQPLDWPSHFGLQPDRHKKEEFLKFMTQLSVSRRLIIHFVKYTVTHSAVMVQMFTKHWLVSLLIVQTKTKAEMPKVACVRDKHTLCQLSAKLNH